MLNNGRKVIAALCIMLITAVGVSACADTSGGKIEEAAALFESIPAEETGQASPEELTGTTPGNETEAGSQATSEFSGAEGNADESEEESASAALTPEEAEEGGKTVAEVTETSDTEASEADRAAMAGTESSEALSETLQESSGEVESALTDVKMSSLEEDIRNKLSTLSGDWAVYVKRLDTGETITVNNHAMVAASLIKLYVAGAYEAAVQAQAMADDYGNSLDIMLDRSDNDAANTLINLLGFAAINDFAGSIGASDTQINRRMLEQTSAENYTSVADCGLVLEKVLHGTYVDQAASARILTDLKNQQRTSKIPAGVPSGVVTANKTGELSNVENDAAIIWAPAGTYILVVMSNNISAPGTAQQAIRDISSICYEAIGSSS